MTKDGWEFIGKNVHYIKDEFALCELTDENNEIKCVTCTKKLGELRDAKS